MARQREFDTNRVLHVAMELFWRQGYATTSISDVVAATGVLPGSLYAAFESKEKLYQAAFQIYVEEFFRASLPQIEAPVDAIRTWLQTLMNNMLRDPQHKGCLIVNAITEREAHTAATLEMVDARLDEIEHFFHTNLEKAVLTGAISPELSIDMLAKSLLGTVIGMLTLARIRPNRLLLQSMVDGAMTPLSMVQEKSAH